MADTNKKDPKKDPKKDEQSKQKKEIGVLKGVEDIIKEIRDTYGRLKADTQKFDKESEDAQAAIKNMLDPINGVITTVETLINNIKINELKQQSGEITIMNSMLTHVSSGLIALNEIVNNAIKEGEVVDIRPFVSCINLIVDQINEINLSKLSSKKVEGIKTRIDFIKEIIGGVSGFQTTDLNQQLEETRYGFDLLYNILMSLTTQDVPMIGQNLVEKVIKNADTIKQLTDFLTQNPIDSKQIKNAADAFQATLSLVKNIIEFSNNDMKLNLKFLITKRLAVRYLKILIGSLGRLLEYINEDNFKFDKDFIEYTFLKSVNNIMEIVETIQKIGGVVSIKNILKQYKTLALISWYMRGFVDMTKFVERYLFDIQAIDIKNPIANAQNIQKLLEAILKIKIDIKTTILLGLKLKEINKVILTFYESYIATQEILNNMKVLDITHAIQNIASVLEILRDIKDIEELDFSQKKLIKNLNSILEIINKLDEFIIKMNTKSTTLTTFKAEPFINTIKGIKNIISELKKTTNIADKTIKMMRNIVIGIGAIMGILLMLIPIMGIFIISSPLILIGVATFSLVMEALNILLIKMGPNLARNTIQLVVIISALVLLVAELIILGKLAKQFIKSYLDIQITLAAVVGILAEIALIGFGMTFVLPFVTAFTIGMVAITISVLAILAVVGMLYLLQNIELDKEKIEENVREVMDVVMMILKTLTTSPFEYGAQKDERNKSLWVILGTSTVNMLSSLEGMVAIVAAAISVAGILLIAGMLRVLELLNLDEDKIMKNINKVLSIVGNINTILISEPKKGKQSTQGFWDTVIDYVAKPLVPLWDAILTMAYLAASVISVAGILLIAGMLRILQGLNLDQNRILTNVKDVMDTVQSINDSLNQPIMSTQQFDKGILGGLLSYISPQIGSLWNSIITMAYLASTIINIAGILLITQMLKSLADVDPNIATKSKEAATNVIEASNSVMSAIYNSSWNDKEVDNKSPWWDKALKWLGLGDFVEAIVNLGKLAQLIIVIGAVSKLAKELNSIDLKEGGVDRAVKATMAVLNASSKIVESTLNVQNKDIDKKKLNSWNDNIERQRDLIKQIGKLAKEESKIASSAVMEDVMNGSKISQLALTASDDIIKNITNLKGDPNSLKEKLSVIDALNESLRGMVTISDQDIKNTKDFTDTYIRFINRLDQADLSRLKITERMMQHWAYLAKAIDNNFDQLVLVLSDKMMPMLDKMNETMEGVSEVQQTIISQLTDPTLGTNESLGDTGGFNSGEYNGGGSTTTPSSSNNLETSSIYPNETANETVSAPTIGNPPTVVSQSSLNSNDKVNSERHQNMGGLSTGPKGTKDDPVYAIFVDA